MTDIDKPVVLITGAAGSIGRSLAAALSVRYRVVGLDLKCAGCPVDCQEADLTDDASVEAALQRVRDRHGDALASVVHLAAYFDFTGEPHPLYRKLNVDGTRRLLRALARFRVEQFVYAGTMLVHAPAPIGGRIDESSPIEPRWAYPKSKAAAEQVIRAERGGGIPCVLLHLAGLYDENTAVPTLSQQIARIYERSPKSYLYAGDPAAGQSMVHRDDMIDAFCRAIERRHALPAEATILVGEPEAMSYAELQDAIGYAIHGLESWTTLRVPRAVARAGAWAEAEAEPVIPDAIDRGEKPFIRPFMIEMAEDHYALDVGRARALLGWQPRRRLAEELPKLIAALKRDPLRWYRANGITPPEWLTTAQAKTGHPEEVRARHEAQLRAEHQRFLWAHFLTVGLGTWLIAAPAALGEQAAGIVASDLVCGAALVLLGLASLSWRLSLARWASAGIGFWLLFAPLVFYAPAAAYLNDTLAGMLAIGLAAMSRPDVGVSPVAAVTGPTTPPGWDLNPSSWLQRIPIIALAFVGLYISRYLAAYQLGHIDSVWEPFFAGNPDDRKNGTEEIITSAVSRAWPVSDAGVGAVTYALEIVTGVIGSTRRWRTMPWLVVLFGIMIVPLGVVSITFIIIQPIVIGTWCTLCLIAAAAMLVQIPYSLDELVATGAFLRRRQRSGASLLRVFFAGDTDEGADRGERDDFERPPLAVAREMVSGGVTLPWTLAASIAIGIWLMFTRATLEASGAMADADHVIGALVITVSVCACAEVARAARYLNVPLGAALLVTPFAFAAEPGAAWLSVACGLTVIALSLRRGPVRNSYGSWDRMVF